MINFYIATTVFSIITFVLYTVYIQHSDKRFIMIKNISFAKGDINMKVLFSLLIPLINFSLALVMWYIMVCDNEQLERFMNWLNEEE